MRDKFVGSVMDDLSNKYVDFNPDIVLWGLYDCYDEGFHNGFMTGCAVGISASMVAGLLYFINRKRRQNHE